MEYDFLEKHHLFYPKSLYQTRMERDFRELCTHIVTKRHVLHQEIHRTQKPPSKPTPKIMRDCIQSHINRCVRCRSKLRNRPYLQEQL